jgi:membrane dipeptidase
MIRWDAHACLPLHPDASFAPLQRYAAQGVSYVSINVGMDMNPLEQVMAVIAGFRARIAAEPGRYLLAQRVADIELAERSGRLAIGFDLEGALPLLGRPEMVALYRALGVNQIHFAYNRNNAVAGGCHDTEQGLTPLGRRMVEAVNAAGMLMDCSHTGRRCTLDIMAASSAPVIFSHANPLALVEHGRNVSDAQIKACAATGGVVCLSGVSVFLGSDEPTAADVARHVAYVRQHAQGGPARAGLSLAGSTARRVRNPPGGRPPQAPAALRSSRQDRGRDLAQHRPAQPAVQRPAILGGHQHAGVRRVIHGLVAQRAHDQAAQPFAAVRGLGHDLVEHHEAACLRHAAARRSRSVSVWPSGGSAGPTCSARLIRNSGACTTQPGASSGATSAALAQTLSQVSGASICRTRPLSAARSRPGRTWRTRWPGRSTSMR